MKGYDPVIFDLDGTVVDTVELIRDSFHHTVRTVLGRDMPDEYLLAGVGQPLMTQMRRLSEEHAQELFDVYREYNHRRHDELVRGYDGMHEVLEGLRAAGRRLGIVTSKSRDTTGMAFRAVRVGEFFDAVVTASDTDEHKPSPVPLRICLERLGGANGASAGEDAALGGPIYVGDSPVDIEAGRAAGMTTAAVAWGVFGREALLAAAPDFFVETAAALLALCRDGVAPAGPGACAPDGAEVPSPPDRPAGEEGAA